MSYELKSSIKRGGIGLPIKIVLSVISILIILYFIAPNLLSGVFLTIARPFWSLGQTGKPDINVLSLEAQNAVNKELLEENIELKATLGRTDIKNKVLAYILSKPPFTAYDLFILDVGTKEGISLGDKVYASGSILIGEVAEVFGNTSKVKLYSSYGEKYEVFIGEKDIEATAIGRGGGTFEVVIPRDVVVKEGDTVTIPDISNGVFGIVRKIIGDPARAFSTVIFSEPLNIYEQKWVIVSKDGNNK